MLVCWQTRQHAAFGGKESTAAVKGYIWQYLLEKVLNRWQICCKLLFLALHEAMDKLLLCNQEDSSLGWALQLQ